MKHLQLSPELQERASLYAAGAMTESERREFVLHLEEENCTVRLGEVLEFEAAAHSLAMGLKPESPGESVKARLMAQAESNAASAVSNVRQLQRSSRPSASAWAGWLVAAASVVMMVVVFWLNSSLRSQVDSLNARVAELESTQGTTARLK